MHGTFEETIFRNSFSRDIFLQRYSQGGNIRSFAELARIVVHNVCGGLLSVEECTELEILISSMKFLPGGRYLAYAGLPNRFWNNCYIFKSQEDSRENWSELAYKAQMALMCGGGIGNDYSIYRGEGALVSRTGGTSSGPLALMQSINDQGHGAMQGGSRRAAIYASLSCSHPDAHKFVRMKNWHNMPIAGAKIDGDDGGQRQMTVWDAKMHDFNYRAPMDYSNISLNWDTEWLVDFHTSGEPGELFRENVRQALTTGEPGFSFNFFDKEHETGRNACTEITSEDDGDVCNLGSVNMSRIETAQEFARVVELGTKFLICGTLRADLPAIKNMKSIREKNRRLGLGLMGVHEWLLQRSYRYEAVPELHDWMTQYRDVSDRVASSWCDYLGISRPVARRAIAPTGTIGNLAGTTTGIEPIFAVAYKRGYLKNGKEWHYQYVVDPMAQQMIEKTGVNPDDVETALDLAVDYERRIKFQADVQDYVDQGISSTINLPSPETVDQDFDQYVDDFSLTLAKYADRLRGFTCYPDGARGGQPLVPVPYSEAVGLQGREFVEPLQKTHDICDISGRGGSCGS